MILLLCFKFCGGELLGCGVVCCNLLSCADSLKGKTLKTLVGMISRGSWPVDEEEDKVGEDEEGNLDRNPEPVGGGW
jgi:hypothetical protein